MGRDRNERRSSRQPKPPSKKQRRRLANAWRYREREEGLRPTPLNELLSGGNAEFERNVGWLSSRGRSPRGNKAKALENFGWRPRGAPYDVGDSPEVEADDEDE